MIMMKDEKEIVPSSRKIVVVGVSRSSEKGSQTRAVIKIKKDKNYLNTIDIVGKCNKLPVLTRTSSDTCKVTEKERLVFKRIKKDSNQRYSTNNAYKCLNGCFNVIHVNNQNGNITSTLHNDFSSPDFGNNCIFANSMLRKYCNDDNKKTIDHTASKATYKLISNENDKGKLKINTYFFNEIKPNNQIHLKKKYKRLVLKGDMIKSIKSFH